MKREDITNKKFTAVYRGLDEQAVRQHLAEVADALEQKDARIRQLEEMLNEREENLNSFKSVESSIQEAILSASKAGDEIKLRAQNYSDSIIQKAETEGEQIISRARQRENHMMEHNEDLKRQAKIFRARYKLLIQAQLDLLETEDWERLLEFNSSDLEK
ncbi:septum site-determining protein DivIVA [Jeotgalicoccus coquinae]|uniref:Cell division initiation protein n=1 Tax=Jeotgalicoccus coquinae TaxID=709509 RepID=A0A6V7RJ90_9STAP|nr:DivIVA domain-containing protein [Jeotgalicoccus coquinae]MBB6422543.1 cell division initiation protein [Jeotgalicoccus coquinae]GGE15051.1 septum site-determining protein DivIVA [Jeotgalicoccus coquinae]CAD2078160.1 Septum site-determining protein DivIVA [Jeotgalicoccus coquinae]